MALVCFCPYTGMGIGVMRGWSFVPHVPFFRGFYYGSSMSKGRDRHYGCLCRLSSHGYGAYSLFAAELTSKKELVALA